MMLDDTDARRGRAGVKVLHNKAITRWTPRSGVHLVMAGVMIFERKY